MYSVFTQIFAVRPALGKTKSNSAWPIILINFNLLPEIRTQIENLIPIGVIPGPKSPKSLDSFFIPLVEECKTLAHGIQTYDALSHQSFELHAYLITFSGDLPAISKLLCLRGHGSYSPCRCCLMKGTRIHGTRNSKYYPVLVRPRRPGQTHEPDYDPLNLPLRTQDNLREHLLEMCNADSAQWREELGMEYGINRLSMVLRIGSLKFPMHFPHDIMHLFFENLCPLLCEHWTGSRRFKNTDPVNSGYRLAPHIWEQVGRETAAAYKTIPSEFVGALPDITNSMYKAEFWSFWIQYLGPLLLRNRFPNAKYYRHFCELVSIVKKCLQFTISNTEIDELQAAIVKWVQEYERYAIEQYIYV
jgi:Transposase family tnp2